MARTLTIPREALAELLRTSGSTLTPEAYLASLRENVSFEKFPSRARSSWWSLCVLASGVVLSFLWIPFDSRLESWFIAVLILLFTVIEYRVYRGFTELNPEAPVLGFRNQSAFALSILVYGFYHAFAPLPVLIQNYIEALSALDSTLPQLFRVGLRVGYLAIGVTGGASQFALAWFYLRARGR